MSKEFLLKMCRVQEVTEFFVGKGFSLKIVYGDIIYPHFFISESTFRRYRRFPAERELLKVYGIDYSEFKKKELINYMILMESLKDKELFSTGIMKQLNNTNNEYK